MARTLRRLIVANRSRYEARIDLQANLDFAGYLENDVFVDSKIMTFLKLVAVWAVCYGRPLKLGLLFTTLQWKHTKQDHGLNHRESMAGRLVRICPDISS